MSNLSIKSWAEEDRPREKMLLKGRRALSDAELIAILIGSGSASESAVMLSRRILNDATDLEALGRMTIDQLMEYKGIGQAKAITIAAALELGRRRQAIPAKHQESITSSMQAYHALGPQIADQPQEEFWALFLNNRNRIIAIEQISSGGIAFTLVDPPMVFKRGLSHNCSKIIVMHNHPSGEVKPSQADNQLTKRLQDGGELLGMPVIDHLIIGQGRYYSYRDEGATYL